ncbi:hypothetical protein ARNL5_00834 [Anaerolineae bacterium]|nr:hypothetical protein ARNL5_00834 [Anaerolineae bacterium]
MRFLLDSSGDLTHALNYDPYGVPSQPNNLTTLGFTGEQIDPNDLLYLRARYYHPKLGAFTSVDPVLGVGGRSCSLKMLSYFQNWQRWDLFSRIL